MSAEIYSKDLKTSEDIAEYNKAEISRVFADCLSHDSMALIVVQKLGDTTFRKSVVVGPYVVNSDRLFVPKDRDDKEIGIPLKDIIDFKRIELSDFVK